MLSGHSIGLPLQCAAAESAKKKQTRSFLRRMADEITEEGGMFENFILAANLIAYVVQQGVVKAFRKCDGIYEVCIFWGKKSERHARVASPSNRSRRHVINDPGSISTGSGAHLTAYLVGSQIHRVDNTASKRCAIS